jgi:hypothetical protein
MQDIALPSLKKMASWQPFDLDFAGARGEQLQEASSRRSFVRACTAPALPSSLPGGSGRRAGASPPTTPAPRTALQFCPLVPPVCSCGPASFKPCRAPFLPHDGRCCPAVRAPPNECHDCSAATTPRP